MAAVGIRELKNQLSQYLKRVRMGERLVVTELCRSTHELCCSAYSVVGWLCVPRWEQAPIIERGVRMPQEAGGR